MSSALINAFDATAAYYNEYATLPRLISERLITRLKDLHSFRPQQILDLGCGTGYCLQLMHKQYPNADFIGIDWSYPLLTQAQKSTLEHSIPISLIHADIQSLPFLLNSFDLICANLSLLWIQDLPNYLQQLKTWLKPDGLLLLTVLGLDTFQELHHGNSPYPLGLTDIHNIGDTLTTARWKDVVIDVDHFLTRHSSTAAFYKELEHLGFHTLLPESMQFKMVHQASEKACSISWEVVYGQAWNIEGRKFY